MTTIRNILVSIFIALPFITSALPGAEATSRVYCDGNYCGDSYVYDPDYRHGTYNRNYWSSSLPYSYYYPYASSYYPYYYPYSSYYPYTYSYPTYYYPSYPYSYSYSYPTNAYPQYPTNMQGAPQYPSDPTYKNLSDYYKKLSDYYKAQSDYYKKLDDLNKSNTNN